MLIYTNMHTATEKLNKEYLGMQINNKLKIIIGTHKLY